MGLLFVILVIVALGAVLAWNFYPPAKAKMAGLTTAAEAILGFVLTLFAQIGEGLQEAVKAGYVPKEILPYIPVVIFAWFLFKRIKTTSPVGKK